MKQNTIALNQQSVSTLDELEKVLKLPKTKIVQKALLKLKEQFAQTFTIPKRKKKYMDELAGFIDLKTTKKTNFSQTVDSIYKF